jgi:hypothetical protein
VGGEAVKERRRGRYPATKGRAGGKLPVGKRALRSPQRSLSDASRKAPGQQKCRQNRCLGLLDSRALCWTVL